MLSYRVHCMYRIELALLFCLFYLNFSSTFCISMIYLFDLIAQYPHRPLLIVTLQYPECLHSMSNCKFNEINK